MGMASSSFFFFCNRLCVCVWDISASESFENGIYGRKIVVKKNYIGNEIENLAEWSGWGKNCTCYVTRIVLFFYCVQWKDH